MLLKGSVTVTTKRLILVKTPQILSLWPVSTDSKAEESWYKLNTLGTQTYCCIAQIILHVLYMLVSMVVLEL